MQTTINDFVIDKGIYYLNHAAVSPWPQQTSDIVAQFANENAHMGAAHYSKWIATEQQLKQNIQQLINAPSSDDIALVKNTSEALSMVAYGLPWSSGDNVVIAKQEFPSNRIVWQSLANQGVSVKLVDIYQDTTQTPEELLIAAIDQDTRLLSVSSVQYADGLRMDLKKLGEYCHQHNVLFCVDAIQSLGALTFDVQAVHADFVMADGHKWLMSPEGIGLFYCKESLRHNMRLTQYGWHMTENHNDFDSLEWTQAHSARKFECGSLNMLGIHALNSSISLILARKIEFIEERVVYNCDKLLKKLASIPKIIIKTDANKIRMSGIVAFRHESIPSEKIYHQLMREGVICATRQGNVRFSPHYYTSTDVINEALEILKKIIA